MGIEILDIKIPDGDRKVRAFCDVEINGMIIREFRVIKENGKSPWVVAPQMSWKDPTSGQIRYRTLITLPSELKGEVERLVLNRFAAEMEKRNAEEKKR